jgi:hypothetical protein
VFPEQDRADGAGYVQRRRDLHDDGDRQLSRCRAGVRAGEWKHIPEGNDDGFVPSDGYE